ncbi:MAG: DnaD domain protein [Eubacteriales bacterium]|nr:DnaD domain protein [Eubacteriales bacterium]
MTLKVNRNGRNDYTDIHNVFIDHFMEPASGEYVKVYLMLLRLHNDKQMELSVKAIADRLELTQNKVISALQYWETTGLLTLEYQGGQLCAITMLERIEDALKGPADSPVDRQPARRSGEPERETAPATSESVREPVPAPESVDFSKDDLSAFASRSEVRLMLMAIARYLGHTLSSMELQRFLYMHEVLSLPISVIEFLVEECVSAEHSSIHYMTKVAVDLAENGVRTVEDARIHLHIKPKTYYRIMNALGLRNKVTPAQEKYFKRWLDGFDEALVLEACNRTVLNSNGANLKYTDTILKGWQKAGIHTLQDVADEDVKWAEKRRTEKRGDVGKPSSKLEKYLNFPQREKDYRREEMELLLRDM